MFPYLFASPWAPAVGRSQRYQRVSSITALAVLLSAGLVAPCALAQPEQPQPADAAAKNPPAQAPPANPQTPDVPDDRSTARALGSQALKLFEQKRYQQAYDRFEMAHRLLKAPTLLLFMGRCEREMGRLLAARATLQRVASTPLAADTPPQYREAVDAAGAELQALQAAIPSVQLTIVGVAQSAVQLSVDGKPLDASASTAAIPLDPGSHRIRASTPTGPAAEQTVNLSAGGGTIRVTLTLRPTTPPSDGADRDASEGTLLPAAIAYGAGGAGVLVGAISGLIAKGKIDDVRSRCQRNHCLPEDAAQAREANTLATVSTIGFVLGGAGVAAGVALTIWQPSGGQTETGASAQLLLRPDGVTLWGSF